MNDTTSDIIVIGGGIAGVSAAARLSAHNSVTVLEAESALAYHASGRSAALFEENYGSPSTVALNKASADYHFTANGGYTSARGLLIAARVDEADAFASDITTMGVEQIAPQDALTLVPILDPSQVAFAGYHEAAFDLDTDRMVHDFAKVVRSNKGQVITGAQVTAIKRITSGWQITTPQASYTCDTLVNAAGAWADRIATHAGIAPLNITPLRRSMARLPAPADHDVSCWPMFFGVGEAW